MIDEVIGVGHSVPVEGLFLGGVLAPAGLSISFLQAPFAAVVDTLIGWRRGLGQDLEVTVVALADVVAAIEPFEVPWTRELLFDCGEWTAYLNNGIDGGHPTAAAPYLSKVMGVELFVAVHAPLHGPGHASTQLWVIGPTGEPPLMNRRTIAADSVDGRWSWQSNGDVLPFEQPDRYSARRIRDRFDRPLLPGYLEACGIRADDRTFYGDGLAINRQVTYPVRRETATQIRERFGW